jgi:hypothetical protein
VDHEPEIQRLIEEMERINQVFIERAEFLKKQIEDMNSDRFKAINPFWNNISEYLVENNRLPDDYSKEKYTLHYDTKEKYIYICDGEHDSHPMIDILMGRSE